MEKIENTIRKIGFDIYKKKFEKEYLQFSGLVDRKSLDNFMVQKRNELFLHAYTHIKYYREIFDQIDLIKNKTVDLSRIPEIPLLTKEIIRKRNRDLISDDYQTRKWFISSTGGSTGEPIQIMKDDVYRKWGAAADYFYYKNMLDIEEPTVKKIVLWGSERDLFGRTMSYKEKLKNLFFNTIFLNSLRMTEQDIEHYIHTINSFKPELVRGYAGSLFELCRYAEKKKIPLYRPKIVVSASENLSDTMRNVIESNFGTKVYDVYGTREVSTLAVECKDGLLHLPLFWNYVEVLDINGQPVREGEEGRVVVTNLYNYSMPLIRYEIGDMATLGPEMCSCGQVLPTLKKVNGRIVGNFILKNGTIVDSGFFILLFDEVSEEAGIEKWQVIQEDYDKIRIKVMFRGEIADQFKTDFDKKIRVGMGSECKIRWDIVDEIPKTPSGKFMNTQSLIWK
jgi:phenylacetate-CoA ligase